MIDLLKVGEANALTTKVLVEKSGLSSREIQLTIEAARREGIPLLSLDKGYWIAASASEVEECVARLRHRTANQFSTARALRKSARRMARAVFPTLWEAA